MTVGKLTLLTLGIFILFFSGVSLRADVIVYDEKSIQDSLKQDQEKKDSVAVVAGSEEKTSGVATDIKTATTVQKPEFGPGGLNITLGGMCIGDTVVSSPVILNQTGVILDIKTEPAGLGFSIVRVDGGVEKQVLGGDSAAVLHQDLPAGTYKVYPVNNSATNSEQIKVSIKIGPK